MSIFLDAVWLLSERQVVRLDIMCTIAQKWKIYLTMENNVGKSSNLCFTFKNNLTEVEGSIDYMYKHTSLIEIEFIWVMTPDINRSRNN